MLKFGMLPFLAIIPAVFAQTLESPVPLVQGDPHPAFLYSGPTEGDKSGAAELAAVEGMPFGRAWRLSTLSLPSSGFNEWDLRIRARGETPVSQGDSILAEFWLRCAAPEGGECVTRLNVERDGAPYTKSISIPYVAGAGWRRYRVVFQMAETYAAGGYWIDFWMGQQVQVIDVGGIAFLNYGQGVRPQDLGVDPFYEGAAPDAAWRSAAEERIDRIRRAGFVIVAVDPEGNPIEGAEISARMTGHAFGWGTAVAAGQLLSQTEDGGRYRQFILDNFNMAVLENDLKWGPWEENPQRALDAAAWLHDNGIHKIRGHNLVWPSWKSMPEDVRSLASNPEALRTRILDHVRQEVTATRGLVEDWDVLNEPVTNHDVMDILGNEEIAAWFRAAKEADPAPRLFINDFSILSANGADFRHRNSYFGFIEYLDSLNAPVEGIGMQGHFDSPTAPELMLGILDRFEKLGKPIEITEYDFATKDEELQAQFTRDLMMAAFSHPGVSNFLMWGFWEGRHWKPDGAMIRLDWTSKPMYRVWRELIYERWWTNEQGISPYHGAIYVHGFKGGYEITVRVGERTVSVPYTLTEDGQVLFVTVP